MKARSSLAKPGRCPEGAEGSWASVEATVHILAMQGRDDRLHDALGLVHDVAVPESEDAVTLRPQESVAVCIVGRLVEMLTAVEFDDDSHLGADEVADVGPDHVLAPELESRHLAAAQATPEETFGVGQVLAKVAGEVEHLRTPASCDVSNMAMYATYACRGS